MQMSNDWPFDEPFNEGGSPCVVYTCEHSDDLFTCEICLETQPSFKKKSKLQIVGLVFFSPLYLLGILAYGVVAFFRFFASGGASKEVFLFCFCAEKYEAFRRLS